MKNINSIIDKLAKQKGYPNRKLTASEYLEVLEAVSICISIGLMKTKRRKH